MKKNTKRLLFASLLIGGSALLVKKSQEQKKDSDKDTRELIALGDDWLEKKERFNQSVQQVKKNSEQYLKPFLDETNQTITDFKFQTEPRINQIKEQKDKIVSELNNQ